MGEMLDTTKESIFDVPFSTIADYLVDYPIEDDHVFDLARYSLMDSLGCAMLALQEPDCVKLLGPIVPGTQVPNGARVIGTQFELDPVKAAFDTCCLINWLSFNDYSLQSKAHHPSQNIGAILAVADYVSRQRLYSGYDPLIIKDVLLAIVKSYEIQRWLISNHTLGDEFNHNDFIKMSCSAVVTHMLGGNKNEVKNALSQAFLDGVTMKEQPLLFTQSTRTSWSSADESSRAVKLALMTMTGEQSASIALSMQGTGYYQTFCDGQAFTEKYTLRESAIVDTIYNLCFPGSFYFCSAFESAVTLYPHVKTKLNVTERIEIFTHQAALDYFHVQKDVERPELGIFKITEVIACVLLNGQVTLDEFKTLKNRDERILSLSQKIVFEEKTDYTNDFLSKENQMIPCGIKIYFEDGTHTDLVEVTYPLGHQHRRADGLNQLQSKFECNILQRFPKRHAQEIISITNDREEFEGLAVNEFMDLLVI